MAQWTREALGWGSDRESELAAVDGGLTVGRVAVEFGGLYRVVVPAADAPSEIVASLPGRWRQAEPLELPAVGDWVALRSSAEEDGWAIDHRFERRTQFLRQAAGRRTVPQVVGANVDVVFVVTSLDDDFNPRRVERYLAAVLDGGARPVIVLSKADLSEDPDVLRRALGPVALDTPIEVVSAHRQEGVDRLRAHLGRGRTGALTGSSGVGKSTLVNALVGREVQRTHGVRAHDRKGRHTTTHRELILLAPDTGMLVDTPGMRELSLWTPGDGVDRAFEDVTRLAEDCRFRDCRHQGEPGCAVEAAVARGTLSAERRASYLKLLAEEAEVAAKSKTRAAERPAGRRGARGARRGAGGRPTRSRPR